MNPPPKSGGGTGQPSYKRSWKNLLINKRYQLRFTLFMVILSSLLMVGLGIWVMKFTNEATTVSISSKLGEPCPKIPKLDMSQPADDDMQLAPPTMKLDEAPADSPSPASADPATDTPTPTEKAPPAPSPDKAAADKASADKAAADKAAADKAAADKAAADKTAAKTGTAKAGTAKAGTAKAGTDKTGAGSGSGTADDTAGSGEDRPRRAVVQIEESSMTFTVPADYADRIAAHWKCRFAQRGEMDRLARGRLRILSMLIATGLLLVLGLAAYGIKMTHKVAGPLFKVSLYLGKMRDGRYDKVYNLRKGDQLLEFYDHFKVAHAGIVKMQKDDIDKLKAVIAAAEAAGAGNHPSIAELRTMLERKEKSIE